MKFRISYSKNSFQVHEIQGKDRPQMISHSTGGKHQIDVQVRIVSRNDEYLVPRVHLNRPLVVEFLAFGKITDQNNEEVIIGVKKEVFETLIQILKNHPELQEEAD